MILIQFLQRYTSIDLSKSIPFIQALTGCGEACSVFGILLSFWNKIGPGHLVRRVPTMRGKNIVPPLKGAEEITAVPAARSAVERGLLVLMGSALLLQQMESFLTS